MYRIVVILLAALCAVSCGRRSSRQQTSAAPQMRVFLPASLKDDPEVLRATEILGDGAEYTRIVTEQDTPRK